MMKAAVRSPARVYLWQFGETNGDA